VRIRVAIVDDQALVRTGFRLVLEADGDFQVVGEAGDGRSGVAMVERTRPDVVLMDVRMPDLDGIAATRILTRHGSARVVVLTTFDVDEYVAEALHAGASAFLLKDVHPATLLSTLRDVHAGDAALPPSVARRVGELAAPEQRGSGVDLAPLSGREREVLVAMGQGLTNGEIAARMFLSESTVKTHVGRVLGKLGLRDRVQAVIVAYEQGLVGR